MTTGERADVDVQDDQSALPSHDPNCELCRAEKLSDWFYEDEECWVAECFQCDTPMIVWRPHGMPDAETEQRLMDRLGEVAAEYYSGRGWWPDGNRRSIPDHWHCHARPKGGFYGF